MQCWHGPRIFAAISVISHFISDPFETISAFSFVRHCSPALPLFCLQAKSPHSLINNPFRDQTTVPGEMCVFSFVLVMEDSKEAQVLEKILFCLSSKPYCGDFKEPVLSQHAELKDAYLQVIKAPTDLGTILQKIQRREYKSFRDCGTDICLVFQNSLLFNALLPSLVSISSHGLVYAQRLWTNIYDLPIQLNESFDKFSQSKYSNRVFLYRSCRQLHISPAEWNRLTMVLQVISSPGDLISTSSVDLPPPLPLLASTQSTSVNLSQYLHDVARAVSSHLSSLSESAQQSSPSEEFRCSFLEVELEDEWPRVANLLSFAPHLGISLARLDRVVGEICVHLMERETRGHGMSSIWAHPHRLVWAQPNRTPWWPGMIIAGHDVPKHIETANLSRIPTQIMSALTRLQPKGKASGDPSASSSSSSSQFSIPNLYLVEFFGPTHDFGWVKANSVIDYVVLPDGSTPIDLPSDAAITQDLVALSQATEAHEILVNPEVDLTLAIDSLPLEKYVFETSKLRTQLPPTPTPTPAAGEGKPQKKRKQPSSSSTIALAQLPDGVSKRDRAIRQTKLYAAHLQSAKQICCASLITPSSAPPALAPASASPPDLPVTTAPAPAVGDETKATAPPGAVAADETVEDSTQAPEAANSSLSSPPMKKKRRRKRTTLEVDEHASKFLSTPLLSGQEKFLAAFQGTARLVKHHKNVKYASCPVLHCREVNFDSQIFFLEARSRELRKRRLRAEIALIKRELARYGAAASVKVEEANPPSASASVESAPCPPSSAPVEPMPEHCSPVKAVAVPKSSGASVGIRVGLAGRGAKVTATAKVKSSAPLSSSPSKGRLESPVESPEEEAKTPSKGNSLAMSMMPSFSGK
jgi:hypothetical protein